MTATCTTCVMLAISTVHATCLAPGTSMRSCPVMRLQGTPPSFSFSYTSMASMRSGAQ